MSVSVASIWVLAGLVAVVEVLHAVFKRDYWPKAGCVIVNILGFAIGLTFLAWLQS